ncbi:tRNA wybutosine-synthesizing protein 5-like, partial [Saccoglossus kowalevskii]|uniref:tRNA wybutosine-synthesizing protein 5-like n=1 Tax=Saccoglossus kowalevskii TaxID=10224 RepID=A0ABM0GV43_SACKO
DKSEIIDIDNPDIAKYPNFINVPRYECQLQPGDILFIPALWFHNMTSLDFGIAVNVFWRHLNDSFYDKKDVYSNKDPVIATRASQILDRALKTLDELPEEYRDFYARKMVTKIQTKCYSKHLV